MRVASLRFWEPSCQRCAVHSALTVRFVAANPPPNFVSGSSLRAGTSLRTVRDRSKPPGKPPSSVRRPCSDSRSPAPHSLSQGSTSRARTRCTPIIVLGGPAISSKTWTPLQPVTRYLPDATDSLAIRIAVATRPNRANRHDARVRRLRQGRSWNLAQRGPLARGSIGIEVRTSKVDLETEMKGCESTESMLRAVLAVNGATQGMS